MQMFKAAFTSLDVELLHKCAAYNSYYYSRSQLLNGFASEAKNKCCTRNFHSLETGQKTLDAEPVLLVWNGLDPRVVDSKKKIRLLLERIFMLSVLNVNQCSLL